MPERKHEADNRMLGRKNIIDISHRLQLVLHDVENVSDERLVVMNRVERIPHDKVRARDEQQRRGRIAR